MKETKEGKVTGFLLKNTKTRRRSQSLYDIALQIDSLKKKEGTLNLLKEKYTDISSNMLNRFLSVLKVAPEVLELIKQKKIDNINAIYYMHTLPSSDQIYLSQLLVNRKINSSDIRALRPLMKKFPNTEIKKLIGKILGSKNTTNYLIKFDIVNKDHENKIKNELAKLLNVVEYQIEKDKNIGTIKLTSAGIKKLRTIAKEKNKTFKNLMIDLTSK